MVKPQDSGQPPFDSMGDPHAGKPSNDTHRESLKRHQTGSGKGASGG